MKRALFFITCNIVFSSLNAQSVESILREIEENNTLLSAWREQANADKIANKTGILPDNPEVEYHYLWGNQPEMGNRTDFSASQRFDFPTAYYHKKKVTDSRNIQVDLKYKSERISLLLEAKQTCIRMISRNALAAEYRKRLRYAEEIAHAYQLKFEKGEINILENNKAKLNLLNIRKEIELNDTERHLLSADLRRMNGERPVYLPDTVYASVLLPSDFEDWYEYAGANYTLLEYMEKETEIHRQNEKLQRSLNLPKLSVGYMSEKVLTEKFQGITVGVSIPLWENKNTVKQIKAQAVASEAAAYDMQKRVHDKKMSLYDKAIRLDRLLEEYRENIRAVDNIVLLKKALDAGEVSLVDYLVGMEMYYETTDYLLQTECDYQLAVAELNDWEL